MIAVIRRTLKYVPYVFVLVLLAAAFILGPAHWQIRQLSTPLPDKADILALLDGANRATSIHLINTANQALPAGASLAFPAFVLQWSDGRTFLIDAGMERAAAIEFGLFLERIANAEPLQPLDSVGDQLGKSLAKVTGIAMTHLHNDHVNGARSLCTNPDQTIEFYQTQWQATLQNFTTSDGHDLLANTHCLHQNTLPVNDALVPIPGLPGLAAYAAAGHTPGSTIFFAAVGNKIWIIAGDIANDMRSIRNNLPKSLAYSLLLTPENRSRLEVLRLWLAQMDTDPDLSVVVSHDLESILQAGLPEWTDQ
jgi:glyoxylase-like metal-dependent hydrolase (beta-lactamase superfamily II)